MRYSILLLLCLAFCCAGGELKPFHGRNYILDCNGNFSFAIRHDDGQITPFLTGIGFDAADKSWKRIFNSSSFTAECLEHSPERAVYRFRCKFAGPKAEAIKVNGEIEAVPEWVRVRIDGRCEGEAAEFQYSRILFQYAGDGLRLTGTDVESKLHGEEPFGIRLESSPLLRLHYEPGRKSGNAPLHWIKQPGQGEFHAELGLEPFFGKAPVFSRLSAAPLQAHVEFARYCNVLLEDDRREATLLVWNRSGEMLDGEATLRIGDHLGNTAGAAKIRVAVKPGAVAEQTIRLPVERYGWYELQLDLPGTQTFRRSFCLLPPVERKFAKGSIFGGIIYPWNSKTVEKLNLMHWIGMSTIRRAYPIVRPGVALPAEPYTAEDAALLFREQECRGIEPIPRVDESWKMPAGTFRLNESSNEANIRRLPVDYAEELKIEYVKTKLHDPKLKVGSTGMAGVDLHWLEELQESGIWDYFDALFVHLHCFPRAPEVNNTMTREFWLHDRVTLLRELMNKYGEKPVYDSENGYLTRDTNRRVENYPLRSVSDSTIAAAFMVRCYLQSLAYGVSNKMWFTVDSYGGFGITEYDQPLPAYPAYAAMTRMLDGAKYAGELLSPGQVSSVMDRNEEFSRSWFGQATPGLEKELLAADRETAPEKVPDLEPYVYIRAFRQPDNSPLLACWATLYRQKVVAESIDTPAWNGQKPGVSLLWNGTPATVPPEPRVVRFRVGVDEVEVADMMGNRRKMKTDHGFITLRLDDCPQFVYGAAPALLAEAERFSLRLFPAEFRPETGWKTLIQAVLPAEGKHPGRKSVFDKPNLSATLEAGRPYSVSVRLTNLGTEPERGDVKLRLPEGWKCEPAAIRFEIAPGREKAVVAVFQVTPDTAAEKVKIVSVVESGRLGRIADSVMNVRVAAPK